MSLELNFVQQEVCIAEGYAASRVTLKCVFFFRFSRSLFLSSQLFTSISL
jgi:hypothetical protein